MRKNHFVNRTLISNEDEFLETHLPTLEFFRSRLLDYSVDGSGKHLFLFRCPFCGDSHKSARKRRGNLYRFENTEYYYHCHNCGDSYSFVDFLQNLKELFGIDLYDLWKTWTMTHFLDSFDKKKPETETAKKTPNFITFDPKQIFASIESVPEVKSYAESRKIPNKFFNTKLFSYHGTLYSLLERTKDIFSTEFSTDNQKFMFLPMKFLVILSETHDSTIDEIVPCGVSLRLISDNSETSLRYIRLNSKNFSGISFFSNIIGDINTYKEIIEYESSPCIILEGEIDSMMFEMPSFAFKSAGNMIKAKDVPILKNSELIYCFDSDYTNNIRVFQSLQRVRDSDYVVLWHTDKKFKIYKDPNAMIKSGDFEYPLDNAIKPLLKKGLEKTLLLARLEKKYGGTSKYGRIR